MGLNGQVAFVTGGSRGIGRAIALALAEAEASVAVNYLTSEDRAKEVARAIEVRGAGDSLPGGREEVQRGPRHARRRYRGTRPSGNPCE